MLLSGILAALIALVGVVGWQAFSGGDGPGGAGGGNDKPPKLKEGQTVTREEVNSEGSEPPKPSREVDTSRIKQTYKPGHTYRSMLKVSVNARGTHHEWGLTKESYIQYVGEFEIERTIKSNDGKRLVLVQSFPQAKTLVASSRLKNIEVNLPGGFQTLLDAGGAATGYLPPGWTEMTVNTANKVFDNPAVLTQVNRLKGDNTAKLFSFVDSLEGKRVRLTYVNGKGITSLRALNGSLTRKERDFIMASSVISDAYVFPDPKSKPGDTWQIHGRDFGAVIDPSMRARLSGTVTARRGPDGGTPQAPTARIKLTGGVWDLVDVTDASRTKGKWAPKGHMVFDFNDGIITHAELSGDVQIARRSTDHFVFETRWSLEPEYRIVYDCKVEQ
jgi:hypothetical protein